MNPLRIRALHKVCDFVKVVCESRNFCLLCQCKLEPSILKVIEEGSVSYALFKVNMSLLMELFNKFGQRLVMIFERAILLYLRPVMN